MTRQDLGHVGSSVPRAGLPRLVAGQGRYVDDISLPGMLHAAVVRSSVAHAELQRFDASEGLAVAGVHDVITAEIAAESLNPIQSLWRSPGLKATSMTIGESRLRYVGQPYGLVVATDRATAMDAVDQLAIDLHELPAVVDLEEALAEGAPLVYDSWDSNLAGTLTSADDEASCEEIFASASVVIDHMSRFPPIVANPLETRGIVADWDAGREELTVWLSTQAPHDARDQLAAALGLSVRQVQVVAPDVGGAFGSKVHVYADEVLVCLAAIRCGRPVKWIESRDEHFVATDHGRDSVHRAQLALTTAGKFLAMRTSVTGNLGAYASSAGIGPFFVSLAMFQGPYRFERVSGRLQAVVTNTTPSGSYRGFGNTESTFVRERLIDEAARQLGIDPIELRLMNMVEHSEMPYKTRGHAVYDSGDFPAALRAVRDRAEAWAPPQDGRRHGVGYGFGVEYTGLAPARDLQWISFHVSGHETARVEMHIDGSVTVWSALIEMGQGLETALGQIAAESLGLPLEQVKVVLGDTRSSPYSSAGSMTSRSVTVGGPAVQAAARTIRAKLLAIGAHQLQSRVEDLVLTPDGIRVGDEARSMAELAEAALLGWNLPDGMPNGLVATETYEPQGIAFSYAAHAAAVAVDPETGEVEVEAYWVAHDCGVVVNPSIVEAQIHGGIAQGIGNALFEEMTYDRDGQPMTTFDSYEWPRSRDIPDIVIDHQEFPSPITPGGMKGMGEGGTIVSVATVGNAVAAALPEVAERIVSTPLSASRVWAILNGSDTV